MYPKDITLNIRTAISKKIFIYALFIMGGRDNGIKGVIYRVQVSLEGHKNVLKLW